MRVDFNVPVSSSGAILDCSRIRRSVRSISYVIDNGGSVVLMAHLGRPSGMDHSGLSLVGCASVLAHILGKDVPVMALEQLEGNVNMLKDGDIVLLENLRFYVGEEACSAEFSKRLANLGEVYVNDAFGSSHRKHSSTYLVPQHFPHHDRYLGFLVEEEINLLTPFIKNPKHPFYIILGGGKLSTKLGFLRSLSEIVDGVFIAGKISHPFLYAAGTVDIECDPKSVNLAIESMGHMEYLQKPIYLPEDWVLCRNGSIGDIGVNSVRSWLDVLQDAQMVFWNGPVGIVEYEECSHGTVMLAEGLSHIDGRVVAGGGETLQALGPLGLSIELSSGGGASLAFLANNGHLPSIDVIL